MKMDPKENNRQRQRRFKLRQNAEKNRIKENNKLLKCFNFGKG